MIRVPLIARLPGGAQAGRRLASQVSLVDVAPSVLDALGLPPLAGARGSSWWRALREGDGQPGGAPRYAFSEAAEYWDGFQATSVRSPHFKVIRRGAREEEIYDLVEDPQEERNLAGRPHLALRALRGQLEAFGGAPAAPQPDRDTQETLRALGYVDAR